MVKILGLKFNHVYEDTKSLRYGHLMIMTDQDHDGSHIKGVYVLYFDVFIVFIFCLFSLQRASRIARTRSQRARSCQRDEQIGQDHQAHVFFV